jgi:CXXC-20-CXXC protein
MFPFLKGMQCPSCHNTFLYIEAKNKSFSLQSSLNCPHCDMRLQNPEHLRKKALYLKMLVLFALIMSGFMYMLIKYETTGLIISIPFVLYFIYLQIKAMKLKNGYIQMVRHDESTP